MAPTEMTFWQRLKLWWMPWRGETAPAFIDMKVKWPPMPLWLALVCALGLAVVFGYGVSWVVKAVMS